MTPDERLEWAVADMSLAGETVSGDLHLVESTSAGIVLAVVDGLGHGPEAAEAARTAVTSLRQHLDEPLVFAVRQCHRALRRTRGVVMAIALLELGENRLSWLGIGNVEARLIRRGANGDLVERSLLLRGGIIGHDLPETLIASTLEMTTEDTLILATDGIHPDFTQGLHTGKTPQDIADDIMAHYLRGTDDALVLVARLRGGAP